jgi:two-component system sensor kinase FixL
MDATHLDNSTPLTIQPISLTEERVRSLYRGMPLSIGITLILDMLLTLSNWNVIGHGDLIVWNVLMLCAMLLRTVNWFFWRNAEANFNAHTWLICFRVGTLFAGITWGSASYFMFADYNITYQALLAFTLAGVASGSLTSLVIDKFSAVGFVTLAILPLSIRLHAEHGQIAVSMSIMVALFIIFVLSAAHRARQQLENNFAQKTRLIEWGNERLEQQKISKILSQTQALFIADNNTHNVFEKLLADTVAITHSQFGFIAEILYSEEKTPSINMLATTSIAENKNGDAALAEYKHEAIELSTIKNLFGATLSAGKPIINNTPTTVHTTGKSEKPRLVTAFIGIPIFNHTQQVAILVLANKTDGYSEVQLETLKPITHLIAQFMIAIGHRRQHLLDEESIKRQAKHTQAILDGAFDGIITLDKEGIITSFNHAAEAIFGYRAQQIIGNNLSQLMPTSSQASTRESPIKELSNSVGIGQELIGVRKNGKEFEMELALSTIEDEDKISYIGVIRDISNRKQTDKLKNEFIATMSHELRTPLTSISASLAIIESGTLGSLPDQVNNLIQIAKQNSGRLQNLINDLLDMNKLLSNNIELNYSEFDAVKLVQKTMTENQYIAEKHNVKFQIIRAENDCNIFADPARTQQVLTHLLSNAAKFSHAHTTVDISITKHNNLINILVADHGAGIAPEFKTNIFSLFTQGDSSSTRQKDGSGIGLSISKELIEKMSGKIGFSSSPGQGSSFYVELPQAHH